MQFKLTSTISRKFLCETHFSTPIFLCFRTIICRQILSFHCTLSTSKSSHLAHEHLVRCKFQAYIIQCELRFDWTSQYRIVSLRCEQCKTCGTLEEFPNECRLHCPTFFVCHCAWDEFLVDCSDDDTRVHCQAKSYCPMQNPSFFGHSRHALKY
mgnify:CR=1 FL=1